LWNPSYSQRTRKKIANFHQKDDSILYASCFDANGGIFEALLNPEDAIISDELNHASIIDGVRLCKSQKYKYKHLNMDDLEKQLQAASSSPVRLIVTDGIFSMDGDIAPLDKIVSLANKYNSLIMIDECHATGFFGKTGKGTPEYFNVMEHIDIINSTLGKALGGALGGYTTARQEIIDTLRQKSRPYLFSNSLPPSVVGSTLEVLNIITTNNSLREKLMKNTTQFRSMMKSAGFTISGNDHCPIAPVMIYDAKLATEIANEMLEQGIYVIGFSFPVVPKDQARIRVQLSAAHSEDQIQKCVSAFTAIAKRKNLLK